MSTVPASTDKNRRSEKARKDAVRSNPDKLKNEVPRNRQYQYK